MHSDLGHASWVECGPGNLHDCRTGPALSKDNNTLWNATLTMNTSRQYDINYISTFHAALLHCLAHASGQNAVRPTATQLHYTTARLDAPAKQRTLVAGTLLHPCLPCPAAAGLGCRSQNAEPPKYTAQPPQSRSLASKGACKLPSRTSPGALLRKRTRCKSLSLNLDRMLCIIHPHTAHTQT